MPLCGLQYNIKEAGTFTTSKPLSSAAGVKPDCEQVDKVVTEIGDFLQSELLYRWDTDAAWRSYLVQLCWRIKFCLQPTCYFCETWFCSIAVEVCIQIIELLHK